MITLIKIENTHTSAMENSAEDKSQAYFPFPQGTPINCLMQAKDSVGGVANVGLISITLKNLTQNKKYVAKNSGLIENNVVIELSVVVGAEENITNWITPQNGEGLQGTLKYGDEYVVELECSGNVPGTVWTFVGTPYIGGDSLMHGYGKAKTTFTF